MNVSEALALSARLLGLSVALQAIEMLALRTAWGKGGIWLAPPRSPAGPGAHSLAAAGFLALQLVRLAAAAWLVMHGASSAALAVWLTTLGSALVTRSHFNGGSDSMTSVVSLALGVAALGSTPIWQHGALYYCAVQCALSYFVAGWVKVKEPRWRSGSALGAFLALRRYAVPPRLAAVLSDPVRARWASWGLLAFEVAFPAALFWRDAAQILLPLALGFHLLCAWALGLNRFWPAWLATYPAVWWVSGLHA